MAFTYSTEYSLGRRGRINRSYTGVQALIAIAFDLALGFSFGLVGLLIWFFRASIVRLSQFIGVLLRLPYRYGLPLIRSCIVTAYHLVFAIIQLPFRIVRAVFPPRAARAPFKPAWASFDEL
jgi:hypothetical protein